MGVTSIKSLTASLRRYDRGLYAQQTRADRVDVYRRGESGHPHYLFSLTSDWRPQGEPVHYGTDVVLNRIRAMDLWRDDGFVERWLKEHEEQERSAERSYRTSVEGFLYDFAKQFSRATNDINTSTLKKLRRKEGSHGFSESR